jgi:hypothetical protein
MVVPTSLPDFDSLTLTNRQTQSVTYLSFGSFDFNTVWEELRKAGASSCNLHSSPDNESIELEVFFAGPATNTIKRVQGLAAWQFLVSAVCVLGLTACSLI